MAAEKEPPKKHGVSAPPGIQCGRCNSAILVPPGVVNPTCSTCGEAVARPSSDIEDQRLPSGNSAGQDHIPAGSCPQASTISTAKPETSTQQVTMHLQQKRSFRHWVAYAVVAIAAIGQGLVSARTAPLDTWMISLALLAVQLAGLVALAYTAQGASQKAKKSSGSQTMKYESDPTTESTNCIKLTPSEATPPSAVAASNASSEQTDLLDSLMRLAAAFSGATVNDCVSATMELNAEEQNAVRSLSNRIPTILPAKPRVIETRPGTRPPQSPGRELSPGLETRSSGGDTSTKKLQSCVSFDQIESFGSLPSTNASSDAESRCASKKKVHSERKDMYCSATGQTELSIMPTNTSSRTTGSSAMRGIMKEAMRRYDTDDQSSYPSQDTVASSRLLADSPAIASSPFSTDSARARICEGKGSSATTSSAAAALARIDQESQKAIMRIRQRMGTELAKDPEVTSQGPKGGVLHSSGTDAVHKDVCAQAKDRQPRQSNGKFSSSPGCYGAQRDAEPRQSNGKFSSSPGCYDARRDAESKQFNRKTAPQHAQTAPQLSSSPGCNGAQRDAEPKQFNGKLSSSPGAQRDAEPKQFNGKLSSGPGARQDAEPKQFNGKFSSSPGRNGAQRDADSFQRWEERRARLRSARKFASDNCRVTYGELIRNSHEQNLDFHATKPAPPQALGSGLAAAPKVSPGTASATAWQCWHKRRKEKQALKRNKASFNSYGSYIRSLHHQQLDANKDKDVLAPIPSKKEPSKRASNALQERSASMLERHSFNGQPAPRLQSPMFGSAPVTRTRDSQDHRLEDSKQRDQQDELRITHKRIWKTS